MGDASSNLALCAKMIEEIKEHRIRVGTVVRLRTYNVNYFHQKMTVEDVVGIEVKCVWFDRQERLRRYWFGSDELVGVTP